MPPHSPRPSIPQNPALVDPPSPPPRRQCLFAFAAKSHIISAGRTAAVPHATQTVGASALPSADFRQQKLQDFVAWSAAHITGDEKGQAQIFLDRLFQAFGQKGSLDVSGTAEMRIRKASEDDGGTSFADYVWKPVVLIEMKKRGANLAKHYRQAFDYWVRLVPDRPQYVVLCNFDEFWVFDFNNQLDSPKDKVKLTSCMMPGMSEGKRKKSG